MQQFNLVYTTRSILRGKQNKLIRSQLHPAPRQPQQGEKKYIP